MDPQAAWERLLSAYAEGDRDTIEVLAEGLLQWLEQGGFPPRAVAACDLGDDWDRALALAGCRHALCHIRKGDA